MADYITIDNKLFDLQNACISYGDPLANWVLFAVSRYISTDRANMDFLEAFCKVDSRRFSGIISKCLSGDKSDDAIVRKFKRMI